MRKLLVTLSALAATALVPLAGVVATAPAAHAADFGGCLEFMEQFGAGEACAVGARDGADACVEVARDKFGVPEFLSQRPCELATRP
ncbi:hypothetical protein [Streptomyces sp. NPDC048111]|uniref:hypothetical protein n=1 Tax=Streptomyces sp. NPDC048111 TaxID=3365500 RepID=UPI00371F519B